MDTALLAWAAGFFDGEGSVYLQLQQNSVCPRVSVGQTVREPLDRFSEMFSGRISVKQRATTRGRTVYTWGVNGVKAITFLKTVRPYLVVKARQADVAIQFWEEYGQFKEGQGRSPERQGRVLQLVADLSALRA